MFIQSPLPTLVNALDARVLTSMAMLLLGATLVLAVGFAPLTEVHNATHDTRHATGFPCH